MPAFPRHLPRRHHLLSRLPEPTLHTHEAHRREYGLGLECAGGKVQSQQGEMDCGDNHHGCPGWQRAGNALHACPQAALLPQQHQPQEGSAGTAGKDRALPGRKRRRPVGLLDARPRRTPCRRSRSACPCIATAASTHRTATGIMSPARRRPRCWSCGRTGHGAKPVSGKSSWPCCGN